MPGPPDEAQQLADLFTKLAGEVDAFRSAHYDELSPQQRGELEECIQQLYDFHDHFAGDAIQHTIDAMQGDLSRLTTVTREAKQALQHLNSFQHAIAIVSAVATLATDIMTADYGALPEAVRVLTQAVHSRPDKSSSGA